MSKNSKTSTIHAIGMIITGSRQSMDKSQAINGGIGDLVEQCDSLNGNIFMLTQQSLLVILVNWYSVKDVFKVTEDDKVRLTGIMLSNNYI